MDAAEVDRLRERLAFVGETGTLGHVEPAVLAALLDALEQARKERDELQAESNGYIARAEEAEADASGMKREVIQARAKRDAAQQDAKDARALLADLRERGLHTLPYDERRKLDARIEAMLEQKP